MEAKVSKMQLLFQLVKNVGLYLNLLKAILYYESDEIIRWHFTATTVFQQINKYYTKYQKQLSLIIFIGGL